jgi:hypothetical protein
MSRRIAPLTLAPKHQIRSGLQRARNRSPAKLGFKEPEDGFRERRLVAKEAFRLASFRSLRAELSTGAT